MRASRLGLTSGQVWTLSLGLLLGLLLLVTSVPPVWERRGRVAPAAAGLPGPAAVPPPAGGLLTGLVPAPVPAAPLAPEPVVPAPPAPLALEPAPPAPLPASPQPAAQPAPAPAPSRTEVALAPSGPLRVREAGYTSSAAEPGLPPGGLPVSARLGERISTVYVRLAGGGTLLTVPLSSATGANLRPEEARLRACRITTSAWRPERPGPGVPFDADDCVDGTVSARDVRFDLGVFADLTGPAGFALVADLRGAAMTSPRTFRLTLAPEATA